MIYERSPLAIVVFALFIAVTLGLSFLLGGRAKSSQGFFAAHGQIPWFVNGVAFAGDYLSAASFLGICGMIAFYGYDGFLYSIGFLAGWIVALFVVAEPLKRLGQYTFADALDAKFDSRGIKLAAGVSTLAVSVFYLIPQMVGAGVLVQPLLALPHAAGVVIVGTVVIVIVVTAGMVSTTYVQFLKGTLLVIFTAVLTALILIRGFSTNPGDVEGPEYRTVGPLEPAEVEGAFLEMEDVASLDRPWPDKPFVRSVDDQGIVTYWQRVEQDDGLLVFRECQSVTETASGERLVNGLPRGTSAGQTQLRPVGRIRELPDGETETGPLGPLAFFRTLQGSTVVLWSREGSRNLRSDDGAVTTIYYPKPTSGDQILRPGEHPRFRGIRSERLFDKLNFLSLMLALFCGTASLPHILIRYYTVKDELSARRSTIVGIGSIGFFYVLTLYVGLGAMTSGSLDVTDSNMAAPLLAKSFGDWLFAIISAIAFTTVLGTVSGLILASSGAVAHDLAVGLFNWELSDRAKVRVAKVTSLAIGAIAIVLGILFRGLNVSYLVGWAFSVAASANLPSLVMLLFWKGVTRQGIIAAVVVGMVSSLAWILLSADTFTNVYGLPAESALVPFSQPGIVTIPLGFVTLIVVSLLTKTSNRDV